MKIKLNVIDQRLGLLKSKTVTQRDVGCVYGTNRKHMYVRIRDDHGNGIPNGNGNPIRFTW